MNLGEAAYRAIAGRTPKRELDTRSQIERGVTEAGGVSQLARALGVSRTTVQRWRNRGSQPTAGSQELLKAVLRRADLREVKEAKLRTVNALTVKGHQDGRPRTVVLRAPYLAPGTMGRAVEAYLRGATPADLWVVVWAGITDKAYRWMFQPPGGIGQAAPAEQGRAARDAAGGHGGSGAGARGGGGDDEEDEWDDVDEDDDGDYLDDVAYEDAVVDVADGDYGFS